MIFEPGGPGEQARWLGCIVQERKQNAEHFGRNVLPAGFVPSRRSVRISVSKQYLSYRGSTLAREAAICRDEDRGLLYRYPRSSVYSLMYRIQRVASY